MSHNEQVVSASALALTIAEEAAVRKTALLEAANVKINMLETQHAITQKIHADVIAELATKLQRVLERVDDKRIAAVATQGRTSTAQVGKRSCSYGICACSFFNVRQEKDSRKTICKRRATIHQRTLHLFDISQ